MIIESLQLLSTAHHVLDGDFAIHGIYKATHINHPCAVWVRESYENYMWLWNLTHDLMELYKFGTDKFHNGMDILIVLRTVPAMIDRAKPFTPPPKCMPDQFKLDSVEDSYKLYLNHKYQDWINRQKPIKVEWYGDKPSWVNI